MEFFNWMYLVIGFIFTFFVPGYLVVETFFKGLPKFQKLPLVMLLSVLISTYLVYVVSLVFGYSRGVILLTFALFIPWFLIRKINIHPRNLFTKDHLPAYLFSFLIGTIFLLALVPAIFTRKDDYFVMSAVNWQDTAMHLSIIETISQGNFPPEAPYFSGYPLNYYYFIDFHSAILETLYDEFFPRILVYDNPLFSIIFVLSVYSLAYYVTKDRRISMMAMFVSIFAGNFMFIKFFQNVVDLGFGQGFFDGVSDLLASGGYTMEYGKLMQVVPMVDYYLQNRPMMLGLPAVIFVVLLTFSGYSDKKIRNVVLAGLITGFLIKFQLFAFIVSLISFGLVNLVFLGKLKIKNLLTYTLYFMAPVMLCLIASLLLFDSSSSIIELFKANFEFGPWDKTRSFSWYLLFYLANFGIPFLLAVGTFIILFIRKKLNDRILIFLFCWMFVMFIIPNLVKFTIYDGDMFKFFYFMMIPVSIISGLALRKIWVSSKYSPLLVSLILVVISFTAVLTFAWSILNKNGGYSLADYEIGNWIRQNTLKQSTFFAAPTVHSSISEIGGRVRVLSYITWPYSHGFNRGEDNVFSRLDDVEKLYRNSSNGELVRQTLDKYNAKYLFYGNEERLLNQSADEDFNKLDFLQLIYEGYDTKIYERI